MEYLWAPQGPAVVPFASEHPQLKASRTCPCWRGDAFSSGPAVHDGKVPRRTKPKALGRKRTAVRSTLPESTEWPTEKPLALCCFLGEAATLLRVCTWRQLPKHHMGRDSIFLCPKGVEALARQAPVQWVTGQERTGVLCSARPRSTV